MSNVESNITHSSTNIGQEIARPAALQFDPAHYLAELNAFDLTDAQKHELLKTLWSIMCGFVELGFSADVCSALLGDANTIPANGELR